MRTKIYPLITALIVISASHAQASYTTTSEAMKIAVDLDFTAPRSYYDFDGKTLSWRVPAKADSHYMRVRVSPLAGGNPITGGSAKAVLTTRKGKTVGSSITLHATWDSENLHYGANIQVPDTLTSGNVSIKIDPPKGRRLSREEGDFFTKPVTITFKNVDFTVVKEKPIKKQTTQPVKVEWPKGRRPYVRPTPYPGSQ